MSIIHTVFKVLKNHLFTLDENNQILGLLSALIRSTQKFPWRYVLINPPQYNRASIGSGSFGTVHWGSDPNLCIKVTNFSKLNPDFDAVRPNSSFGAYPRHTIE
jgi:hypothetical protein